MTPSLEYVFTSCEPLGFKVATFTAVIQSTPPTNNYTVGSVFKDVNGNCWTYIGAFVANSYIPPQGYSSLTFDGDYFSSAQTTIYQNCATCVGGDPEVVVTSVNAGTEPCIGGTVDDHLGWSVNINVPAPQDINYQLDITLSNLGIETVYSASGTIKQGETFDSCNQFPCSCGGAFIGGGYQYVSACITQIDGGVIVPQGLLC